MGSGTGSRADSGGAPCPQELTDLPDYNKISFKEQAAVPLREVLPDASPQALDLLGQFLLYPPRQRVPASQVGRPLPPPVALVPLPRAHMSFELGREDEEPAAPPEQAPEVLWAEGGPSAGRCPPCRRALLRVPGTCS